MDSTERHLRAVPDLPEERCRYGDGQHGPCGGPSNGRECWDHKAAAASPPAPCAHCGHPVSEHEDGECFHSEEVSTGWTLCRCAPAAGS
jgi:hypothetical protein